MQKHLSENFSIENLAELLGVSSSYFNRLFVKETGLTPLGYLNHLRIAHAALLLSDTILSVDEVAKKCGFSCGIPQGAWIFPLRVSAAVRSIKSGQSLERSKSILLKKFMKSTVLLQPVSAP